MCVCVRVCMLRFYLTYSRFLFLLYLYIATMVIKMSSSQIGRYKEEAKADMIRCNRHQIRCPCRTCKLVSWIDPDSGQLEKHLLRRGFWIGFNKAPTANGAHENEGGREDEESPGHGYHDEGDAGGQDHHDEGDAPKRKIKKTLVLILVMIIDHLV